MMMLILWIVLTVLAIDNLSDILTEVDLFEWYRIRFQLMFPRIGKIAVCKYCQSWWISIPAAYWLIYYPDFMPVQVAIAALAIHRISQLSDEFFDRYKNRAPTNVFANVNMSPLDVSSEKGIQLNIKAKNDSFSL